MAPSAEKNVTIDFPSIENVAPRTNVTFAVNYEVQMVNQFLASERKRRVRVTDVDLVQNPVSEGAHPPTNSTPSHCSNISNAENKAPNFNENNRNHETETISSSTTPMNQKVKDQARRSTREKGKRAVPLARSRVRYDMQLVPAIKRNKAFLKSFPIWWMGESERPRRTSRLMCSSSNATEKCNSSEKIQIHPFQEGMGVVWKPSNRAEWEDSVNEMTAVCTSAAIRRYNQNYDPISSKPFHAPLSRDYIRDRVDIDDPLYGYQIRHQEGGWLQGFILYTNFTTWTHCFKWDSRHPMSGINQSDRSSHAKIDFDGALADELDAQPRSGDPQVNGIVFSNIAEIGLVGGLGCGEYLLRMALDSIREMNQHKYVVLQATEQSKTFYERYGFIRVGSVCRYGKGLLPPEENTPVSGYRHWTHPNESEQSLQKHGGPSYMMCLKLPQRNDHVLSSIQDPKPTSFLSEMLKLSVQKKPKIEQLGATTTPGMKFGRRSSTVSVDSVNSRDSSPRGKKKIARKTVMSKGINVTNSDHMPYLSIKASPAVEPNVKPMVQPINGPSKVEGNQSTHEQMVPKDIKVQNNAKRKRTVPKSPTVPKHNAAIRSSKRWKSDHTASKMLPRETLLAPPPEGKPLSYAEKQYHSVWLAVPPQDTHHVPRPPRRVRCTGEESSLKAADEVNENNNNTCASNQETVALQPNSPPAQNELNSKNKSLPKNPSRKKATKNCISDNTNDRQFHCIRGNDGGHTGNRVDKSTLMKQKVKSYPRSRVHYYNRVVKPKMGHKKYFFVLNYNEEKGAIRIVPMEARGILSGKREGRPRYQAIIGDTDHNFITVSAQDYEVVSSAMVMKTPVVASEAWDIEDD